MEQRTIYLKIGTKDRISLKGLVSAMRNFLGILEDMDAAMSQAGQGAVQWEVIFLQKNSPPVIGVRGIPLSKTHKTAPTQVRREVLNGVRDLASTAARKPSVSDSVLLRFGRLAEQSKHTGPMELYIDKDKKGKVVEIAPSLLDKIEQHIGKASESTGSIAGQLDTIAVHRSNEIRVWDENYGRAVRCEYTPALEDKIKSLLRHRVLASGLVFFNAKGQPVSVRLTDIEPYPSSDSLPSIEEMAGLLDDPLGGQSLKQHMEELSNG